MKQITVPSSDAPRASIIILGWRDASRLERCLRSLAGHVTDTIPSEVVVVLNGASPEVVELVERRVAGAVVVRSRVNLGFAGGCNRGARNARGEYLVLLNDDAEVEPGWLEWLVQRIESAPDVGAAGSRILFEDGTLQEAGSVIWSDGSTAPVGRGLPGDSVAYSSVREVDYASASSLIVRREAWEAVGGLDEAYFPAYYEDADLAMALRGAGYRVLYEPRSVIRHVESASTESDFKQFLFDRNIETLRAKWADGLGTYVTPDLSTAEAARRSIRRAVQRTLGFPRRLLVVDDRPPEPELGSGFGRMFDCVRELAQAYAVTIAGHEPSRHMPSGLADLGVELVEEPLERHLQRPDTIYDAVVISRPHNYDRAAPLVRRLQPHALLVYDGEALFFRRMEREAELTGDPDRAAAAADMRRAEAQIAAGADLVVAISDEEAAFFRSIAGHAPVEVVLPVEPFIPATEAGFAERDSLLFVAGWLAGPDSPNVDGLVWFVEEVLARIRAEIPWARLRVTGSGVPGRALALESPWVEFVGHVERLADVYNAARVVIAPIRAGAGVKRKTTEALQHGVPVVATSVGAEGIKLGDAECMDVADDPAEFASAAVELLRDRRHWERRRAGALAFASAWRAVAEDPEAPSWPGLLRGAFFDRAAARESAA